MRVPVPHPRSIIQETPSGLEVTIPSKRNAIYVAFIGVWLVMWCLGEASALAGTFIASGGWPRPGNLIMGGFLLLWTVGGVWAFYCFLWFIVGKERVILRSDLLTVKRDVFGFGRVKEYDLHHVAHLRVSPAVYNPFDPVSTMRLWGLGAGVIAFDYGAKTVRCGISLDEAEAQGIVTRLRERYGFGKGSDAA